MDLDCSSLIVKKTLWEYKHVQTHRVKYLTKELKQVFGVFELIEKGNILQCAIFLIP